jgi:hypothetical protein
MRARAGDAQASPRQLLPVLPRAAEAIGAALVSVVQEAYVVGVSTRKVDQLVESLGLGISKSDGSRICQTSASRSTPSARARSRAARCFCEDYELWLPLRRHRLSSRVRLGLAICRDRFDPKSSDERRLWKVCAQRSSSCSQNTALTTASGLSSSGVSPRSIASSTAELDSNAVKTAPPGCVFRLHLARPVCLICVRRDLTQQIGGLNQVLLSLRGQLLRVHLIHSLAGRHASVRKA